MPGSSDKSRHSIQVGVWYEERVNREYELDPRGLWNTGRNLINQHLNTVDTNNIIGEIDVTDFSANGQQFTGSLPIFGALPETNDGTFFRRVRERLGLGIDEFVNIDGLTPDQLSLDLFSAEEITFADQLDYQGYDYLNNEFNGSFDDFFTIGPDGQRSFNVAPFRPIYAAAYIQDKFTVDKMIFRVGVRLDRYDANTRVLKDPYSLYEVISASDFHANFGGNQPGAIGDDFVVYTDVDNGTNVQAYRDGENWYFPNGTQANGPQEIEGIRTGLVFPKYANPAVHEFGNFIKEDEFTVETSFQDYEVQFNVMPRLAFSFPISDEANFFAHYDVLVQRPPSNSYASPLDYYYFVERPGGGNNPAFNNPALRPERTVDYEVGFQQKLSNSSALKIAAFYKEMRDMIQRRTYFPVPLVGQYQTFDNQDFGTVKGFSFSYDLRRTANVQVNANYTLQFADGTGSDADSQQGLSNRGNLRTLFPLDFDERHRFNFVLDYRLGNNEGPKWLRNAGVNLQGVTVSGRPYTRKSVPSPLDNAQGTIGAINGSRRPFNFTLNGQIDKNFKFGKNSSVNVYFRVSNVLNRRNILDVYEFSGVPDDPGYLASSFGQDVIRNLEGGILPVDSYRASYQWRILNDDFFSLPRRMFLGARFNL